MSSEILEKVSECISKVRTIKQSIQPGLYLKKNLGFESIDMVDLLFEIEQEFKVKISMREFDIYVKETVKSSTWDFTVLDICNYIQKKQK